MVIYTNFFLLSREFVLAVPPPLFRATSNFRVGRNLPGLQEDVCFLCFRLLSRRCHDISSIPRLFSCPSQNRTSSFPTYGSSMRHSGRRSTTRVEVYAGPGSGPSHTG